MSTKQSGPNPRRNKVFGESSFSGHDPDSPHSKIRADATALEMIFSSKIVILSKWAIRKIGGQIRSLIYFWRR